MSRVLRMFVTVFAVAGLLMVASAPASAATAAPSASPTTSIPVVGNVAGGGAFNGTLNILNFANQNGQLVANGLLSGTVTNALGHVVGTVTNVPVTVPVAASGSCQVLHLVLGPLDLNLLGLMVHLNTVVLDITAQSGSGNLLGNLICAVTHLLDNTNASTNAIANFLNRILGILNGI